MEKRQSNEELRVEALPTEGQLWAEVRSFLVAHMPHSWKLLGTCRAPPR